MLKKLKPKKEKVVSTAVKNLGTGSIKKKNIIKDKNDVTRVSKTSNIASISKPIGDELRALRYYINSEMKAERHLMLKRNAGNAKSLLVANVPGYLDLDVISAMLSQFVSTPIEEVEIQRSNSLDGNLQQGQRTVSFTFSSEKGPVTALTKCASVGPYCAADFGQGSIKSAITGFCEEYKSLFASKDEIQKSVELYVQKYDEKMAEERRLAKKGCSQPDEEGWITVTSMSKKSAKAIKIRPGENTILQSMKNQHTKKEAAIPFYKFQIKQSKLKKMEELRSNFEEDKKRVALAKAARHFKPL